MNTVRIQIEASMTEVEWTVRANGQKVVTTRSLVMAEYVAEALVKLCQIAGVPFEYKKGK